MKSNIRRSPQAVTRKIWRKNTIAMNMFKRLSRELNLPDGMLVLRLSFVSGPAKTINPMAQGVFRSVAPHSKRFSSSGFSELLLERT